MTHDPAIGDDTRAAFEAARYRIFLDNDSHVLHIGARCPAPIATWISRHAASRCAWLITANNPYAERIDAARNNARDALLHDWARRHASAWLDAINEDPSDSWPDERGVLIANSNEGEVHAIARRFGQAAIVVVQPGRSVYLHWI